VLEEDEQWNGHVEEGEELDDGDAFEWLMMLEAVRESEDEGYGEGELQ